LILDVLSINQDISREKQHLTSHINAGKVTGSGVNSTVVVIIHGFLKLDNSCERIIGVNDSEIVLLVPHIGGREAKLVSLIPL
jgi:hypothetical protein